MRAVGFAFLSALLLAACNPSAPGQSSDSGGVFPDLTSASYRVEASVTNDGTAMPVVMYRDGQRQRLEVSTPAGPTTMIMNTQTGESYVITNAAGQQMVMRMTADQFKDPAQEWSAELAATARRTGSCAVAGENGSEWTREQDGETHTVCVTDDGIVLRTNVADRTSWEVTSVQRGPQSADLFALPAGAEVIDLGDLGAAMQQQLERAQREAGQ